MAGADLLIHDAQYTAAEYPRFAGWGHSPVEFVVDLACAQGVCRLALFHHDPRRDDAALAAIVRDARTRAMQRGSDLEVFAAEEGWTSQVSARPGAAAPTTLRDAAVTTPIVEDPVMLAVEDGRTSLALAEAVRADGLRLLSAEDAQQVLAAAQSERPALVILGRRLAGRDGLDIAEALSHADAGAGGAPAVVIVAQGEQEVDRERGAKAGVLDWLVAPFKTTYARTRVHCWLLRRACHWEPAPLPGNEALRLGALCDLGTLDTPPEKRFDRITRIAAALFDVPIALVSLVDADRQWFKSHHGLDAQETPRELAFCAHAILADDPLVVPDAHHDIRFADNPLVTGPPHVRFYAGVPLHAGAPEPGSEPDLRVGTLCLIDQRPRQLQPGQLRLLRDMARLVEVELAKAPMS